VALIQDADYGVAGWLYGIYTSSLNVEHYTTVLNAYPKLRHIAVVVCDRVIKCSPNEKQPVKKQVKAADILVARRHIILTRGCVGLPSIRRRRRRKVVMDNSSLICLTAHTVISFLTVAT